jgi:hypothetical protein
VKSNGTPGPYIVWASGSRNHKDAAFGDLGDTLEEIFASVEQLKLDHPEYKSWQLLRREVKHGRGRRGSERPDGWRAFWG